MEDFHKLEYVFNAGRWYAGYRVRKGSWINAWADSKYEALKELKRKKHIMPCLRKGALWANDNF